MTIVKQFTTLATIFLVIFAFCALITTTSYALWLDDGEPIGGISVSELEDEARDAYFSMSNASETLARVTSKGLDSSFRPKSFDTLIQEAADCLVEARSRFESGEYNVTAHLVDQAMLKVHSAEVELEAHHEMLFETVLRIAGAICAFAILIPILVHFHHKRKGRKEFIALEKHAARHQHQTRSLLARAARGDALLPDDLEGRR